MGNWVPKEINNIETEANDKPNDKTKVVAANWDPRSPTNGISRTPILFLNGKDNKDCSQTPRSTNYDPRSPTCIYNRTPLILKEKNRIDIIDDSIDSNDSSCLLQQVPEEQQKQSNNDVPNDASPDRFVISTKSIATFTSNLPRHIIQRKQVEKINRKKYENGLMDKENQ